MFDPMAILIVEDTPTDSATIAHFVKKYLGDGTFDLFTAATIVEAFPYRRDPSSLDLVFMDCFLPDGKTIDGYLQSMRIRHPEAVLFATSSESTTFHQQMEFCDCGLMKGRAFTFNEFVRQIRIGHARRLEKLYG